MVMALALAGWSSARAECSPGQQQEADLAYASAFEFMKIKDWQQAVPRLESILEFCPDHVNSMRGLGKSYLQLRQLDQAKETYETAIGILGNDAQASDYATLGQIYAKMKEYGPARANFERARALDPGNCGILFNLALMYMGGQNFRDAVKTFESALQVCPQLKDNILPQLATACEMAAAKERKIGNADRAAVYEQKYSEFAGRAGGSKTYDLVKQHMRDGNFAAAETLLLEMVGAEPDNGPAWLSLARCQDQLGKKSGAISSYEKYIALKPGDEKGTTELILAYAEAGRCDSGVALARRAKAQFQPKGKMYLGGIYYAWGKALECAERYPEAKSKFVSSVDAGNPKWVPYSREEIERMDQLEALADAKRRKAAQGG